MLPKDNSIANVRVPERAAVVANWLRQLVLAWCRLRWRITTAAFFSILAIEVVILVPSYRNFEHDRIVEFARAATAVLDGARSIAKRGSRNRDFHEELASSLIGVANIRGLVLTGSDVTSIVRAGPSPALIRSATWRTAKGTCSNSVAKSF